MDIGSAGVSTAGRPSYGENEARESILSENVRRVITVLTSLLTDTQIDNLSEGDEDLQEMLQFVKIVSYIAGPVLGAGIVIFGLAGAVMGTLTGICVLGALGIGGSMIYGGLTHRVGMVVLPLLGLPIYAAGVLPQV